MKKRVLFLGRFQPFHKGHLMLIKKLLKKYSIIIAMGGRIPHIKNADPFTFKQRKLMIRKALLAEGIKGVPIFPVPNTKNDKAYVEHVEKFVKRKFDAIISGNPWVWKLFKAKGYKIIKISSRIKGISSTDIRKRMKNKKPWKHLVPKAVADYTSQV